MTRERWLENAADSLRFVFADCGYPVPEGTTIKVSCGWPSVKAGSKKNRAIGQCFPPELSTANRTEIFISPFISDEPTVLATLVHEMAHAIVGCQHGHKAPFKRCAQAVGLTGKMTATTAGLDLQRKLENLHESLGDYPHATVDTSNRKKQSTRLIKLQCEVCGYTVRTTAKWLEEGIPTCCCGNEFSQA